MSLEERGAIVYQMKWHWENMAKTEGKTTMNPRSEKKRP